MRFYKFIFFTVFFFIATQSFAQARVSQIFTKNDNFFITNKIGYDIGGTYFFEGKVPPIAELSENGTGMIQSEDLSKKNIVWGIQCSKSGTPKVKKGFDSAKYTFWYKDKNDGDDKWIEGHFSIHFKIKKMFVLGNRSKTYIDKKY